MRSLTKWDLADGTNLRLRSGLVCVQRLSPHARWQHPSGGRAPPASARVHSLCILCHCGGRTKDSDLSDDWMAGKMTGLVVTYSLTVCTDCVHCLCAPSECRGCAGGVQGVCRECACPLSWLLSCTYHADYASTRIELRLPPRTPIPPTKCSDSERVERHIA